MAPMRRRKPPSKAAAASTRVRKITSREHWESVLEKSGDSRIVVVQYFQSALWQCKQMRPLFNRHSTNPKFRRAVFVEVDVDEHEAMARGAGVTKLPTYQCYYKGELVDSYSGTLDDQVQQMIQRAVAEHCVVQGSALATAAKLVTAAAVLAGGALLFARLRSSSDDASAGGGAGSLLDVKKRMVAVQGKLRALEKANRGKQARAQRKLLEQLSAQRRALERGQQKAAAGESKADAAGAAAAAGGVPGEGKLGRRGSAGAELDFDALARLRRRRRRGEALYSDEEEALEAAGPW